MTRRVCHISTVHVPIDVRVFYRECASLADAGYETHLVIPADESKIERGVHIHAIRRVHNRLLRMIFMPWVAMFRALRTRADIYHYHDPELLPMGFVLRWILWKRVVYDIHEPIPQQILGKQWLPRWSRRMVAFAYRVIERVLTPGQVLVLANENSRAVYGPSAIVVRNYPLIVEPFTKTPTPVDERPQPPLLVYVGAMSRDRGADVYVELAHRLKESGRAFRMMLVGPCAPPYEAHLRERLTQYGLEDCVALRGRTEYLEAMSFVAQATVGLCVLSPTPNHKIALATKILEYMMLGTPVLATNIEGWRKYVEGERSGVMVDPDDMDDVVRGCERMLDDPSELAAMGARGVEAVRTRYNWSTEFGTLSRCYERLLLTGAFSLRNPYLDAQSSEAMPPAPRGDWAWRWFSEQGRPELAAALKKLDDIQARALARELIARLSPELAVHPVVSQCRELFLARRPFRLNDVLHLERARDDLDDEYFTLQEQGAPESEWRAKFSQARVAEALSLVSEDIGPDQVGEIIYELDAAYGGPESYLEIVAEGLKAVNAEQVRGARG